MNGEAEVDIRDHNCCKAFRLSQEAKREEAKQALLSWTDRCIHFEDILAAFTETCAFLQKFYTSALGLRAMFLEGYGVMSGDDDGRGDAVWIHRRKRASAFLRIIS